MSAPVQHAHDLRPMAPAPDAPLLYRGWVLVEDPATRIWAATKAGCQALNAGTTARLAQLINAVEGPLPVHRG